MPDSFLKQTLPLSAKRLSRRSIRTRIGCPKRVEAFQVRRYERLKIRLGRTLGIRPFETFLCPESVECMRLCPVGSVRLAAARAR